MTPETASAAVPHVTARDIRRAVDEGRRLTREEALHALTSMPLLELGEIAQEVRFRKVPEKRVTYVVDSNPNYTNVCTVDCTFCAFYRKPSYKGEDVYTLSIEKVLEHFELAQQYGCTTVLLQGGLNPAIPWEFYPDLVRAARERYPDITPHFFSAPEIQQMVEVSGLDIRSVLTALREAGQVSLPGGGAEILSARVRKRISPKKGGPEAWLDVHRIAHEVGLRTTATMMYGHVETAEDVLEHLESIRALQEKALAEGNGGFTAFIPWSYKRDNTPLKKWVPRNAGPARYLRTLAASRLVLDNFDHVQATWFSEGKKTGQVSLHFGADDFGGTLFEENVHKATGHVNMTTVDETKTLIRESGFAPAQRTTLYEILSEEPLTAPTASLP
ncbi:MAG: cyclic dehypoxanthinyl futalosine synthase [Candidatus Eiseniibacteriota bacterium]